jgi:hypothetical protein
MVPEEETFLPLGVELALFFALKDRLNEKTGR